MSKHNIKLLPRAPEPELIVLVSQTNALIRTVCSTWERIAARLFAGEDATAEVHKFMVAMQLAVSFFESE